jgi:hypothetical protein
VPHQSAQITLFKAEMTFLLEMIQTGNYLVSFIEIEKFFRGAVKAKTIRIIQETVRYYFCKYSTLFKQLSQKVKLKQNLDWTELLT